MEIISKSAQLDKMKLTQRHIWSWISNDSDKPYVEESFDIHPHRIICKVDSHKLNKITDKPTGRHKYLTPNKTVVGLNDLVDQLIDLDPKPTLRGEVLTDPAAPSPMVNFGGLRFSFFAGGNMVSKSITKCIKHLKNDKRRNKLAMRE